MNSLDLTQFVGKLPKAGKTILDSYSPNIVIPIVYLQSLISFTSERHEKRNTSSFYIERRRQWHPTPVLVWKIPWTEEPGRL